MFDERKTQDLNQDRRGGQVVGLRNMSTGATIDLEPGRRRWLLGSDSTCEVVVDHDPYVSGLHCIVERRQDGTLVVRDRDSRNGTFIDGNPVEAAELRVGSYLQVGRTTLVAVTSVAGSGSPIEPAFGGRSGGLQVATGEVSLRP